MKINIQRRKLLVFAGVSTILAIFPNLLSFFSKDNSSTAKINKLHVNDSTHKINKLCVGESLSGDGNEVANITLLIGPRDSSAESAFASCLTNQKNGFTSFLVVVAPNLMVKPATVMFNKVIIESSKQTAQMFGSAQRGVAMAIIDSVENGTISADEANDLFISVGVFIHKLAKDGASIEKNNYDATKQSIVNAITGKPTVAEVLAQKTLEKYSLTANKV